MSIVIPTRGDLPFYDLQIVLEDVTYTLEFRWNVRAESWFMNVLDGDGVNLLQGGLRLVAGTLQGAYTTGRQPPGAFVAVDTSGQDLDPGETDLGERVKLIYFSSEELGLD